MSDNHDDILHEMETILKQVTGIARKLQHLSSQVISKEELLPLQKEQNHLLKELVSADEAFEKASKGKKIEELGSPVARKILALLNEFQGLNANFIANLSNKQELINFINGEEKEGDIEKQDNDEGIDNPRIEK